MKGFEPSHLAAQEPKSCASANSATSACDPYSKTQPAAEIYDGFDFNKYP